MTVGAYELTVLSPTHVRAGEENADSLVLQADRGDTTLLMMGDVTAAEEAALALPDCDILKIPHHGSGTASSALLLEKTTPADAVISVGTPNRYGFPKADVLQRLEEANVSIWRTDEAGAVTVTFAEEGYTIKGYAPKTWMEKLFGVRGE